MANTFIPYSPDTPASPASLLISTVSRTQTDPSKHAVLLSGRGVTPTPPSPHARAQLNTSNFLCQVGWCRSAVGLCADVPLFWIFTQTFQLFSDCNKGVQQWPLPTHRPSWFVGHKNIALLLPPTAPPPSTCLFLHLNSLHPLSALLLS